MNFEHTSYVNKFTTRSYFLGVVKLGQTRYRYSDEGWTLHWIHVNWLLRGKGYGRQLLEVSLGELAKKGVEEITLHSVPQSVGFYHKLPYCQEVKPPYARTFTCNTNLSNK